MDAIPQARAKARPLAIALFRRAGHRRGLGRALAAKGLQAGCRRILARRTRATTCATWSGRAACAAAGRRDAARAGGPGVRQDNEQAHLRCLPAGGDGRRGAGRQPHPRPSGSAAVALEVFTREKIGVESDTLADAFLGGALQGPAAVQHHPSSRIGEAVKALKGR